MPKLNNKSGQIVFSLIAGIVGLIILSIVCLLIVDTLNGADLLSNAASVSIVNESVLGFNASVGDNLAVYDLSGVLCTVANVKNATTGTNLAAANWTATNCNVKSLNLADQINTNVKVDYSYTWDGESQNAVNGMISNYTDGLNNVSSKIPTILLVAAVVLLFGAIVFLVNRAKQTTGATGGSL